MDEQASLQDVAADDAAPDHAPIDASLPRDAASDQGLPPIDARRPPDVVATGCPDAAATLVYVITSQSTLMSFYPPTATFMTIGRIACAANGGMPNSMAVDRNGTAYVSFRTGALFRVSTATAGCQPTAFVSGQQGFATTFGMGYSGDNASNGETLYVAGQTNGSSLASVDTKTFSVAPVGRFNPPINSPELTGTGSGDLFAFYALGAGSAIGQIDKTSARVTAQSVLAGVAQGSSYAFAFWGGDFYTFTAPSGSTIVTRFRPSDGSTVEVATSPENIVGAGVSTCAPQM